MPCISNIENPCLVLLIDGGQRSDSRPSRANMCWPPQVLVDATNVRLGRWRLNPLSWQSKPRAGVTNVTTFVFLILVYSALSDS